MATTTIRKLRAGRTPCPDVGAHGLRCELNMGHAGQHAARDDVADRVVAWGGPDPIPDVTESEAA